MGKRAQQEAAEQHKHLRVYRPRATKTFRALSYHVPKDPGYERPAIQVGNSQKEWTVYLHNNTVSSVRYIDVRDKKTGRLDGMSTHYDEEGRLDAMTFFRHGRTILMGEFVRDDPDSPDIMIMQNMTTGERVKEYEGSGEFVHFSDLYSLNARLTAMSWFAPANEPEHELLRELRLKDMECGGDREMYNTHVAL